MVLITFKKCLVCFKSEKMKIFSSNNKWLRRDTCTGIILFLLVIFFFAIYSTEDQQQLKPGRSRCMFVYVFVSDK